MHADHHQLLLILIVIIVVGIHLSHVIKVTLGLRPNQSYSGRTGLISPGLKPNRCYMEGCALPVQSRSKEIQIITYLDDMIAELAAKLSVSIVSGPTLSFLSGFTTIDFSVF